MSKVANFSIDLPEASVAVQLSGTFGSRQEEAQRLGRILRPKRDGRPAWFFTLVFRDTNDQEFASRRQRFLAEHHARYPVRLYDARGRYLFHSRPKLDVLVKALNYGVARGRDNEP